MTDKQIIVTFSDGYCIVLEDNKVSIRENEFTKLCIVFGNRTNELLEFVKNIYLDNKCKEQECEELKKIINEAKNSKLDLKSFLVGEAVQNEYEQQLDQLKQTLVGIKEIAEKAREDLYACESIIYADDDLREILQKISEVEDVR